MKQLIINLLLIVVLVCLVTGCNRSSERWAKHAQEYRTCCVFYIMIIKEATNYLTHEQIAQMEKIAQAALTLSDTFSEMAGKTEEERKKLDRYTVYTMQMELDKIGIRAFMDKYLPICEKLLT